MSPLGRITRSPISSQKYFSHNTLVLESPTRYIIAAACAYVCGVNLMLTDDKILTFVLIRMIRFDISSDINLILFPKNGANLAAYLHILLCVEHCIVLWHNALQYKKECLLIADSDANVSGTE
ncbi:hypothetical protein Tcan_00723, partial [Toxocara canis]